MQEDTMGFTDLAFDSQNMGNQARWAGDESLFVRFFKHPCPNPSRSSEMGRPCFDEKDYIQIMQPGNKESIVMRPASQEDKQRFSKHYKAFKDHNTEEYIEGTLLSEWPGINRGVVEELKYLNVRTVEQLVEMSDSNAQGLMGVNLLKDKARAFLEMAETEAQAEAVVAAEKRTEAVQAQLEKALSRIEALEALQEEEE